MIRRLSFALAAAMAFGLLAACNQSSLGEQRRTMTTTNTPTTPAKETEDKVVKTDAEWRKLLTPEQYKILREHGTERAFTGKYYNLHEKGIYRCAACGNILFRSDEKFDSGTGWPSFWKPASDASIETSVDRGFFTTRTEVRCRRCGGHLGHVFDDGPKPTSLRYCINSAALRSEPQK